MKTTHIHSVVLFLIAALGSEHLSAQQYCQSLLQGGTFDASVTTNDSFASDYFRSRYCNSGTSSSSGGFTLDLPIDDVPVELGASSSDSSSHNICNDRTSSSEDWRKFLTWSRKASPVLAKAFVDCVKAEGIQLWTERSQVTNALSLNVRVNYYTPNFSPVKIQFSFSPSSAVGKCGPKTKTELEQGVSVGNFETFKVVCAMTSHTEGVEIGLVASSMIPYGNMAVRSYRPRPVIALSTDTSSRSGVKTPAPSDATYAWGADTLLDHYEGAQIVTPQDGKRWAAWNVDGLTPGLYRVYVTYAAAESRPLRLLVDGTVRLTDVAASTTGGWEPTKRQQTSAGEIRIDKPTAELRLETKNVNSSWPHFKELRLVFVSD